MINKNTSIICQCLSDSKIPHIVGGSSLLGLATGVLTKYTNNISLYIFNYNQYKIFFLFFRLLKNGILLKPKFKSGHLRFKLRKKNSLFEKNLGIDGKIYVMISDGECQEGTTWESLLIGAKHCLDNLVVLIDYNKIQALTTLEDALPLDNLSEKFKAFNWDTVEVLDGHSFEELLKVFKGSNVKGKPRVIIVNTVKGKGVKAFEHDPKWHAKKIKGEELEIGKKELGIV